MQITIDANLIKSINHSPDSDTTQIVFQHNEIIGPDATLEIDINFKLYLSIDENGAALFIQDN